MQAPIKRNNSRIKTPATKISITRDQAEAFVSQITDLTIQRNQLLADRDEQVSKIHSKFELTLGNLEGRIKTHTEIVRDWASDNPEEFGKKKSIVFSQGTIGFRTGTPKLKTLPGWTFARVLDALRSIKWGAAYIRLTEEVNKQLLIADEACQNLGDGELKQIGLRIDQEESFFIEPAVTEPENRQQVATEKASSSDL